MMWMISPGIPKCPGRPSGTVEGAIRNNSFVKQKQEVNSSTIKFNLKQVRGLSVLNPYHYATDASSCDGDIWSILHPPANWLVTKSLKLTVCYNGLHTHTQLPQFGAKAVDIFFTKCKNLILSQWTTVWPRWGRGIFPHLQLRRCAQERATGGRGRRGRGGSSYAASIQEPTKEGKRKKGGERRKRRRRRRCTQLWTHHPGTHRGEEERERKERQGAPSYAPCIQGRAKGRAGVAAEVLERVVAEMWALLGKALTCVIFCLMATSALWLLRRATTSS